MNLAAARARERLAAEGASAIRVFRAPGRVNLIGEHTDYSEGFVMPAAIDLAAYVAVAPREDRALRIFSDNYGESVEFDLDEAAPAPRRQWSDYPRGVSLMLTRAGVRLRGANLAICSEVPQGAGLASSAALEVATALALLSVAGVLLRPKNVALLCQRAENEFVGARCGVMDQFIACYGREGYAVLLDCRSLESRRVPLPPQTCIVIADTTVKHDNAAGEYNLRRQECETAARIMGQRTLRDVRLEALGEHTLPIGVLKRARHVITENARTQAAAAALASGDLGTIGRLMAESHESLRDDYEVSCVELDAMVDSAAGLAGLHGIRMTGGGFGGSAVSLVEKSAAAAFTVALAERYQEATGLSPRVWVTAASEGAGEVE